MKNKNKVRRLEALQDQIIATYVATSIKRGAEDYAPLYKKFPKLFKQLVKSEMMTDKGQRKYFKELAERVVESLDWFKYEQEKASTPGGTHKAADILDYLVEAFWEGEILNLKINLTGTLMDAIEAGGLYSEQDLQVDVGWSRNEAPAIEFLNNYSFRLAKGLTATTQDRIYSALKLSIDNGEDRDGAVKRIDAVINDKKRATTIAQTESVRAFNHGRMTVAKEIGADRKRWRTAGAIDYCQDFEDEGVVPYDHKYLTPRGAKLLIPPAHPNCRCGHQVFMPDEEV